MDFTLLLTLDDFACPLGNIPRVKMMKIKFLNAANEFLIANEETNFKVISSCSEEFDFQYVHWATSCPLSKDYYCQEVKVHQMSFFLSIYWTP